MPGLYVADTNIYVTAANDPPFRERFGAFILENGPVIVSAIVVAEILIGITDPGQHRGAEEELAMDASPLAPTSGDWIAASSAIARLGGEAITKSRSFWNDALLAAQCARLGATLVTMNVADFRRLGRQLGVKVAAPFP